MKDLVRKRKLDGLDLDIEEYTELDFVEKLITTLHRDFGEDFIITLAPVVTALRPRHRALRSLTHRLLNPHMHPEPTETIRCLMNPKHLVNKRNLSGFNHFELAGGSAWKHVAWFNTQFYCGWGCARSPDDYEEILAAGWPASKVVLGVVTNRNNGAGFVDMQRLKRTIESIMERHDDFGGVMAWEYFNAGSVERPWEWFKNVGDIMGLRFHEK